MMKNTKNRLLMAIAMLLFAAFMLFASCTRVQAQQFDPENHFTAWPIDGGTGMQITLYTGENRVVRIPPTIRGLPVTAIGNEAFRGLGLTSVSIPDSVTRIGDRAFADNQLTSVNIPNSVTSIGQAAFAINQLTSVTIPNNVTSIEEGAFYNNQLTSVKIPDSVTSIGQATFAENRISSISIGANVDLLYRLPDGRIHHPFDNNFHVFYNNNGRRAGVYTWNGTAWSFSER